jgi:class 3 adenylate cyclase/tetratricopeptide (TPR) repeat protein
VRDRFCASCGSSLDVAVTSAQPLSGRSASLQVHDAAITALGEGRKVVTILFADLSGSTVLGERLDPEELRGILGLYFNELARQIRRYEGTIDKYIGDAVMAVFGAPISHEDDAERAINAALAMQQSIGHLNDDLSRQHGVRLALRIGINTGEVVAGLLAGDVQTAYTVVGDAVNTAQRFEAAAPLGEILVSADTRRLAIHSFEFEQTAPLTLKGKAERVVGYRVLRRRYEEIAPEATQFIGRTTELDFLRAAIGDAVKGKGRVVNIVGEAGVGKSRLVGELRANLVSGIDRMTVRCASFETNTPYALVADFIRGAFSIHAADDEATAQKAITDGFASLGHPLDESNVTLLLDILGYPTPSSMDPEVKQRVLVNMLRTLLRLAASRAPVVLTAEDLHWVDSASLRVLGDLVSALPSLACLFITTTRPGWTPPWPTESLTVGPLDAQTARDLIEAVFEVPVDDDLAGTIVERTSGNPFFIEEVVRQLKASTLLVERAGRVSLVPGSVAPVPATIQEVIEAHLDRLDRAPRLTLNAAAVFGRTFWVRVLERLLPSVALQPTLVTLERASFIDLRTVVPEITYGFRQMLFQEVAYETQLQADRRRMHGSVAEAVEALYPDRLEEFVDFLAYHYKRSSNGPKAVAYQLRAGDRALRLYASREALASFTTALERASDDASRARAHEGIGDVRRLTGEYQEAAASYTAALPLIHDDPSRVAGLLRKLGAVEALRGATASALSTFDDALARLPAGVHRERALILLEIGQIRWQQGRYDDAITTLEQALAAADDAGAEDARANVYKQLGTVYVVKGEAGRALDLYGKSLALYQKLEDILGEANVNNNMGIVYRKDGRYDEALAAHERALAVRTRIGDPLGIGTSRNNIAQIERARGEYESAESHYAEALATWSGIGYAQGVLIARTGLGITLVERGETEKGHELLMSAITGWAAIENRAYLSETQRYLAVACAKLEPAKAIEWAARAVTTAREVGSSEQEGLALGALGTAQLASGQTDPAIGSLERGRELLANTTERQEMGRILVALADAYERRTPADPRATDLRREAREIFASIGATAELRRLDGLVPVVSGR